jgi:hypothetical protein
VYWFKRFFYFFIFIFIFNFIFYFFILFYFYHFYFIVLKINGGTIYISSTNAPALSNCAFSNNRASITNSGTDFFYNSDNNNVYSPSNIINTCSSSSTPYITDNSPANIFNFSSCLISDYFVFCKRPLICDDYKSRISCNSGTYLNTKDGRCVWILDENGENGSCIPHSDFKCNNLKHDIQCIHVNSELEGKCKINSTLIQQQIMCVESLHAFLMRMIIINVQINVHSVFYMKQTLKEYVLLNRHVLHDL